MRSGRINLALAFLDGSAALLALEAASDWRWLTRGSVAGAIEWPAPSWLLAFVILWILISDRLQLGAFYTVRSELMARVIVAGSIAGLGAGVLTAALGPPLPGFNVLLFAVGFLCAVTAIRAFRRAIYSRKHLGSGKRHRVVIVGGGVLARELASALESDPSRRYEIAGVLAPEMEQMGGVLPNFACEDTVATVGVAEYLAEKQIDQVYFTLPNSSDPDVLRLVAQCRQLGIAVAFVPHGYELFITRSVLRNIGGIPLVAVDERLHATSVPLVKTVADATIAALLLLILSPVIGIVALLLARAKGNPFRREERCGAGGRLFDMYRFNVEYGSTGPSRFERWLAITKISELPQLWNVVLGDMSLVGPCAETPEQVRHYSEWQRQRLTFRPGVAGYAQLYGLHGKTSLIENDKYDLQYSSRWSPLLELTLMVQTLWFILRRVLLALRPAALSRTRITAPLPSCMEVAHVNGTQPSTD